jgi:NDP-mannose synthase
MKEEFRAIILAGGKGTRLRPYTVSLPKPLVPVGDRPILEIVLAQLKEAGVTRVTMAVNHLAELLMAYFGDGSKFGISIDYSWEAQPLSTIGPLKLIPDLPESFLVMNGDVLTDLNYRAFWEDHKNSTSLASICAYRRKMTVNFGLLDVSSDGSLTGFQEKPELIHYVSMGIYAFRREVLEYVPSGRPFGFDDMMFSLLENRIPVRCHFHSGRWLDIGRPDDYERAQNLLTDDEVVGPFTNI